MRFAAVCLLLLVASLAYAVATGKPVPAAMGSLLSLFLQVLLGI